MRMLSKFWLIAGSVFVLCLMFGCGGPGGSGSVVDSTDDVSRDEQEFQNWAECDYHCVGEYGEEWHGEWSDETGCTCMNDGYSGE